MLKRVLPMAGIVMICSSAHAGTLSGDVGLGLLATTGNSKTTNLNGELNLEYDTGNWVDTLGLSAIKASEDGEATAERYDAMAKAAYNFTDSDYVFDQAEYAKDLFGGIRERISDTAGYGRRILKSDRQKLDVQVGAGLWHKTTQKPELKRTTEAIGTGGLQYELQITENSSFTQQAKVLGGSSNVFLESTTALQLRIYGNLFAKLSFKVDHNTQVPAGTKKTDTYTAVNLTYDFGKKS